MPNLTPQDQRLITLAERGGNDATLLLLDLIHELEDKLDEQAEEIESLKTGKVSSDNMSTVAAEFASKLKTIEKGDRGDPGHTPTDEELTALIEPLIPFVTDGHTPTDDELLSLIRPEVKKSVEGAMPSDQRLLGLIREVLPREVSDERLTSLIKPLIPPPEKGEPGEPGNIKDLSPEEIRNSLELLQGDERLSSDAIKGLSEMEKRLKANIDAIPRPIIRKTQVVKRIRLTDQVDGVTRDFVLPKDTVDVLGLWGTSFPITFDTADWTLSGNQLSLAAGITTPASGQTLMALVEVLFY